FFYLHKSATEISTPSLHDALPIYLVDGVHGQLRQLLGGVGDLLEAECDELADLLTGPRRPARPEHVDELLERLGRVALPRVGGRSEEHTSELQSRENLVCRLLLEK